MNTVLLRKLAALLTLAFVSLLLSGCPELGRNWDDQTKTLYIDYYKEQCDDDSTELCFRIREDSDDSWELADVPFSGFDDFLWGYRYTATVTISYDENGDPSSYSYQSTDTSELVDSSEETFALTVYTDTGILYALDDSTWEMASEVDFDCAASSSCDAIDAAVANSYVTQLQFLIDGEGGISLDSVICASAEDDFASECEGETNVSWYIAPVMSDCGLSVAELCYLFKVTSSGDYELLQLEDGIDDWSYSWGYRYKIDVVKTVSNGGVITEVVLDEDDDSPDERFGSSYEYLIAVRASGLPSNVSGNFTLYSTISLDCEQYSQCDEIDDSVDDYQDDDDRSERYLLLESYVDSDGTLVVEDVHCQRSTLSSFQTCYEDNYDGDFTWGF